jgi:hypothetical protein
MVSRVVTATVAVCLLAFAQGVIRESTVEFRGPRSNSRPWTRMSRNILRPLSRTPGRPHHRRPAGPRFGTEDRGGLEKPAGRHRIVEGSHSGAAATSPAAAQAAAIGRGAGAHHRGGPRASHELLQQPAGLYLLAGDAVVYQSLRPTELLDPQGQHDGASQLFRPPGGVQDGHRERRGIERRCAETGAFDLAR